jgi:hypothetical protein
MTDLPTTAELAAQLEETRGEIAQMKALAEAANASHDYSETEFEQWPTPEEFVAAPPARPVLPAPVQRQPVQTLSQEQLATEGIGIVAASVSDWPAYAERVLATAAENPAPFSRALSSGDPQVVASSLASSLAQVKQADASRQMKLQAQSAVGASGRPDAPSGDAAEWGAIVSAGPRGYWETSR